LHFIYIYLCHDYDYLLFCLFIIFIIFYYFICEFVVQSECFVMLCVLLQINRTKNSSTTYICMPLEEWLSAIRLERYWDAFRDAEFDLAETLANLHEETLKDVLGMTMVGHRLLLLQKAKELSTIPPAPNNC
jgi:SAM domain (Sterile alpha motif)